MWVFGLHWTDLLQRRKAGSCERVNNFVGLTKGVGLRDCHDLSNDYVPWSQLLGYLSYTVEFVKLSAQWTAGLYLIQCASFVSAWVISWWYIRQMASGIMKQSRSKEVPMLRSTLQSHTLPITFIKLSLTNVQNSRRGYSAKLWFYSITLGL